jgi:hypothetical protein
MDTQTGNSFEGNVLIKVGVALFIAINLVNAYFFVVSGI